MVAASAGSGRRTSSRRSYQLAGGALLFVLAVVVPLLRQTGARSWDTIWGEDGWVYFQQAHDHGLGVLVRGYAGYLQLTPRLLAVPSAWIPIDQLALYFAVVAAVVGAALAWFVYWASEGWIDSQAVRAALASLVVLMPALGYENTANITNLIWILFARRALGVGGARRRRTCRQSQEPRGVRVGHGDGAQRRLPAAGHRLRRPASAPPDPHRLRRVLRWPGPAVRRGDPHP